MENRNTRFLASLVLVLACLVLVFRDLDLAAESWSLLMENNLDDLNEINDSVLSDWIDMSVILRMEGTTLVVEKSYLDKLEGVHSFDFASLKYHHLRYNGR